MSYHRSKARKEFEEQLKLAVAELSLLYKFAHKKGASSRLLGAYYVFAYSQLEVYIKTFVEDVINTFNQSEVHIDKWPDMMLGYLLHKTENLGADYRRYSLDEDEGAISKKVALAARKIKLWASGEGGFITAESSDFLDKKKYPSPKNIPQLFKRLGVEKIWQVIGRAGNLNSELLLKSLNDLRTGIAHEGEIPQGFSFADLKDRLEQMRKFVAALDRGVAGHYCSGPLLRSDWNQWMT